jgi:hypothetical protein
MFAAKFLAVGSNIKGKLPWGARANHGRKDDCDVRVVLELSTANQPRIAGRFCTDKHPQHVAFDGWLALIGLLEESMLCGDDVPVASRGPPG